jgi:predicted nucleic acid-binding protein
MVVIPEKVFQELLVLETRFAHDITEIIQANWLNVFEVNDLTEVNRLRAFLDEGESEAIVLAKEIHAEFLLIDESEGRQIAQQEGLQVIGLIGVLMLAKNKGLVDKVKPILEELREKAKFRIAKSLEMKVLSALGEAG